MIPIEYKYGNVKSALLGTCMSTHVLLT